MRRIDRVTTKRSAIIRQKEDKPTDYEKVIAAIEIRLWQQNYVLPVRVESPVNLHPNSDLVKKIRRAYEDAGYNVSIDEDPWPSLNFTLS